MPAKLKNFCIALSASAGLAVPPSTPHCGDPEKAPLVPNQAHFFTEVGNLSEKPGVHEVAKPKKRTPESFSDETNAT